MKTRTWLGGPAWLLVLLALCSTSACHSDKQRVADHLEQGQEYLRNARPAEAALEFQSALKFDPDSLAAHNRLVEIEISNGNPAAALFHVWEAYRIDPTDADAVLHLTTLIRADEPERAEALIEALVEREPDNPAGYIGQSDQALSRGRTRDAAAAARKAMELAPDNPIADWQYGYVLQALIRERQIKADPIEDDIYDGAIDAFERYIRKGGTSPWNAQIEQARVMAAWPGRNQATAAQFRIATEHALEKGTFEEQSRAAAQSADFARATGNTELLEWSLNHLVERKPRNYRSWRDLAELHSKQRKDPEEVWQRFVNALPTEARPHIEYARHLVFAWKLDEAIEYLNTKAREGIDPPALLGATAATQIAAGRISDATATVKRLERQHPNHPRTILQRVQLEIRKGQIAGAARSLRALVEEHPGYNAYLLLAGIEEVSDNLDAAIAAIQKAIASTSFFSYEAERVHARLLANRGDYPGAIRSLLAIQERMKLSDADQVLLARCRYETGREAFGRKILRDLLTSRRPPSDAVIDFARREGTQPESADLARRELEALLRREPKHWDAVQELTRLDIAADRRPHALERLDRLVLAWPNVIPAPIRLLRAQVSADAGREAGTLADAKAAFEEQPRLRGALEMLVALHLRKNQIGPAIHAAEEARRAGAFDASRRLLLGQLYRMKGRDGDALATFEQALESDPNDPTLHYQLGLVLRTLDRSAEASVAFETALALSSSFPEADAARRALEGS
jgi:predicted Zn-dependent protease